MAERTLRCRYCGRTEESAKDGQSTHCSPPFTIQRHVFDGHHPADLREAKERKTTLTTALDRYLERTTIRAFTCQELADAAAPVLGRQPSLMAVSRVMGKRPGWQKGCHPDTGRVMFRRSM